MFPHVLALFSFSIHQFFQFFVLVRASWVFFLAIFFFDPPSMFSVLISNSFRSTPIRFLRPLAVHFVQFRVVVLPVLQILFALTDHVFLCTPFGPSCSYSVFIPQCYLLFGTL